MKAPPMERSVVLIDDVNTTTRNCHVIDKTNSRFQAAYRDVDTAFQVPQQGEHWIVMRQSYHWVLERRWESPDELADLRGFQPGDVRLRVPGTLYLNNHSTPIGAPVGETTWEQLTADGTIKCFVLATAALSVKSIQAFKVSTGTIFNPASYTLTNVNDDLGFEATYSTNRVLKIDPAPAASTITIYYQKNPVR